MYEDKNILLSEATTEQLAQELKKRSRFCVLCLEAPNNEEAFSTMLHGGYIEMSGAIHALKRELVLYEKENILHEEEDE